ncbi:hypothetical protein RGAI101_249 [Roseobacter sp. GAI101]|nr:hypothetical protein RGAI101_249 [Roseobacter sp. GAI101]
MQSQIGVLSKPHDQLRTPYLATTPRLTQLAAPTGGGMIFCDNNPSLFRKSH